jgi:hypothetical protein
MGAIISSIIAVAKAVPIVQTWLEQLSVAYYTAMYSNFKKENKEACDKAKYEHDQRAIEKQMGSAFAGKPSEEQGTTIDDSLPSNISKLH